MKHRAHLLPRAELDLADSYQYLANTSAALAQRFLDSVQQTVDGLCEPSLPGMLWLSDHPRLTGTRWTTVRGFENYLIIFRLDSNRLDVMRILHGARDIEAVLRAPT